MGTPGVRGSLCVPAKRRRALVATNLIEEYPAGTHLRTMRKSVFLPARSFAWASGPTSGRWSGPDSGFGFDFGF